MLYENPSYRVEAEEQPGCLLNLKIEIKPEQVQKTYKKAVRLVNKEISLPGFRKGKAPDHVVIKNYGNHIDREWKDLLINEAFQESLKLTQIYPLTKESIQKPKIESCTLEEGAVISLRYESFPQVPSIDFSAISLPSIEKHPISDDKVQDILSEVLKSHADWEDITDRAVAEGDFVDISIEDIEKDPPKPIVQDRRFEVGKKNMATWLRQALVGMSIGETKEAMSEPDDNASEDAKKRFRPMKLRITLNGIKKIILPEFTDEIAAKSGASSKEDLIEKIRTNLEREEDNELKRKQGEALDDALLEKVVFDTPLSLKEKERRERIRYKIHSLKQDNFSEEEIKAKEQEIESEAEIEAERRLRLYFIHQKIGQQGNITVSKEELTNEIIQQLYRNPSLDKDQNDEQMKNLVDQTTFNIKQRKIKEYALGQVLSKP